VSDWELVVIYSKDAREVFLEKNSVDLFFTHPPYYENKTVDFYGNHELQVHSGNREEYLENIALYVKHMEHALKDNGRILIGFHTGGILFDIIGTLLRSTGLRFDTPIIWNFGNHPAYKGHANTQVVFLNLVKGEPYLGKINSYLLDIPWLHDVNFAEYNGMVYDSLPKEFCDNIIESFSREGDVVGDLMGGTGSILFSAKQKNREIIYSDVSVTRLESAKKLLEGK